LFSPALLTFKPVTLTPFVGHEAIRRRLAQAAAVGKLPQVLLLTGTPGVGKQRLALWLAQVALCQQPSLEPCGSCRSCRLVGMLSHPDLHWFVPVPRPKVSDPDKQIEEAAQLLAQALEERRNQPLYIENDAMASHSIATVRLLQRRAGLTSVEGGRRIFILGDAERLVVQEASQEAANALLKLLEEPPAGSLLILTTAEPRRLLPTIRSRSMALRLGRLTDAEVRAFLEANLRPVPRAEELDRRVAAAEGSIGRALASGEETSKAQQAAEQLLDAVLAGPGASLERALRQPHWAARGEFTAMLDALSETLGEAARGTLGHEPRRRVPASLLRYQDPAPLLQAIDHVADAREAAAGNVNPQLLLAVLGAELAAAL
jgi:DNA polymerase III subunit delta'